MGSHRHFGAGSLYGRSDFPPGIKWLLISNGILFVAYFFLGHTGLGTLFEWLKLYPRAVVELFAVWQLGSYMFLHATFFHLLFNMLALWMFGKDLEAAWGTRKFLKFYFICGVGAGVCVVIGNWLAGTMHVSTLGASGAIYGVLLAFGLMFPDVRVLFFFLFPIKAKYFVMIMGAIAFMMTFNPRGADGVSHVAHLGGMIFGYFYLRSPRVKFGIFGSMERSYQQWKLQRAKRKFQVYLKKRDSDHNRWVN